MPLHPLSYLRTRKVVWCGVVWCVGAPRAPQRARQAQLAPTPTAACCAPPGAALHPTLRHPNPSRSAALDMAARWQAEREYDVFTRAVRTTRSPAAQSWCCSLQSRCSRWTACSQPQQTQMAGLQEMGGRGGGQRHWRRPVAAGSQPQLQRRNTAGCISSACMPSQ